ncbi:MAG TPA: universal stress protein, partial [Thermoplasmata archaeon]|nr:universal stress protein [Thermoplasmata archaeon]
AILMTLRGDRRRRRNPFVGHTASAILHHAACDVLIANRLLLAEERVSRILLPTFSDAPPPKALQLAEQLAVRAQGVPIITLTMAPRGSAGRDGSRSQRSPRGLPLVIRRSLFPGRILGRRQRLPELILSEAARERYGLLLVGEDPKRQSSPLLSRSFLEQLFLTAPCPVLAVRG